jgi:crotonobetainyl-CoA:carnitine CoA-transferase CaiB-like acyl-CoA transferase
MLVMMDEAWRRPLREAFGFLGRPLPELTVEGAPTGLPSTLPVGDTAVACVAAALAAAAGLQQHRAGHQQPADVQQCAGVQQRHGTGLQLDAAHVAAAVRSEAYLRLNGRSLGSGFDPLSRFWRTADGWVRTHANYPWHRAALVRALGASENADAVKAAIAERSAADVEADVVCNGGVAAAVRTPAQWRVHPQGIAVAGQPLISSTSFGGAQPRPAAPAGLPAGSPGLPAGPAGLPAAGLRVLDLTRVIAGPVATRYLAALGADVLRVDPPHRPELPMACYDGLPGKRSAVLDARTPDGLRFFHELLDGADIVVHGYRPGTLASFGLEPEALAERHPGLVAVSLSAWGGSGPWRERRGFDSIVQAACGIAMAESADGETPGRLPCQLLDHGCGYLAAAAAMEGVRRQRETGGTHIFDLSLAAVGAWLMSQPRPGPRAEPAEPPGTEPTGTVTPAPTAARPTAAKAPPAAPRGEWVTTLTSDAGPVTVISPPGRIDGRAITWPRRLASYGQDPPAW